MCGTVCNKIGWYCALVASLMIMTTSCLIAYGAPFPHGSALLSGFCVWGKPMPTDRCETHENSHATSALVNLAGVVIFSVMYVVKKCSGRMPKFGIYVTCLGLQFVHAYAHYQGVVLDCVISFDSHMTLALTAALIIGNIAQYALAGYDMKEVLIVSVLTIVPFVYVASKDSDLFIPMSFNYFFMSSACQTIMSGKNMDTNVGWFLWFACMMGLLEVSMCDYFFQRIGGHVWTDIGILAFAIAGSYTTDGSISQEYKAESRRDLIQAI